MFKKLLIASAILATTSSVAFAGGCYKGDYKGEASPCCPTFTYSTGPYLGFSVGPRVNITSDNMSYEGFEGTLFGGYAAMLTPCFYLGGELYIADSAQIDDYNLPTTGVKTSWNYGLSIMPGYMINDRTLGYIRLGANRAHFPDSSGNATGWQGGLGMQTALTQEWDLRGEYVYTYYNSVSGVTNPQANQFNVGLVYKFL